MGDVCAVATGEATTCSASLTMMPKMIVDQLGPIGLTGFFCNGEIGPVGEKNFVHGFTASLALFVKAGAPDTEKPA